MISRMFVGWYDEMRARRDDRLPRNCSYSRGLDELSHLKGSYSDFDHLVATFSPDHAQVGHFYSPSYHNSLLAQNRILLRKRGDVVFEGATGYGPPNINQANAKIFSGKGDLGVVIVPHWNARSREYFPLGRFFALNGITSAVLTPVHHGMRSMPGEVGASHFVSSDLGRTVRAVQQTVCDAIDLGNILRHAGAKRIVYLGASLGSCVAGLAAAFDDSSGGAVLLLTAGNFADVVWTGRVTRHIRREVERYIDHAELRRHWRIIATEEYMNRFARRQTPLAIFSGRYDNVILPHLTKEFVEVARVRTSVFHQEFGCAHYSMGLPPFSVSVAFAALRCVKNFTQ